MIGVRKGLFGRNAGYGSGIVATPEQEAETRRLSAMFPGAAASMPQDMTVRDGGNLAMQAPERKGGFDWKSVLMGALGGAADGAATFFGGQPLIAQQRQFDQAIAAREAERQRRRAEDLADFRQQLSIRQEFAQPGMDEFDTAMTRAGIQPGTPEYNRLAREYAERKARGVEPMLQGAPLPNGGTYTGPYSGYAGMASGAPRPAQQSDWDSATPLGGPSQPATGGFRR